MRILIPMLLLPVLAFAANQSGASGSSTINVMPLPSSVQMHPGKLRLDSSFAITTIGYTDARLQAAVVRLQQRLEGRTGIVLPRGVAPIGAAAVVTIRVKQGGAAYPKLGEDESYALEIMGDHATLNANTVVGAMHGMETLLQLVSGDAGGYYFPFVNIQDKPRFLWRGLMIDVGRPFEPARGAALGR